MRVCVCHLAYAHHLGREAVAESHNVVHLDALGGPVCAKAIEMLSFIGLGISNREREVDKEMSLSRCRTT